MKNSVKAAICSAAVVPGAGFFVLRQYLLGFCFLVPSLGALAYILRHYFIKTRAVSEQLLLGEIPPDVTLMVAQVMNETDPEKIRGLAVATWVFLASWIISIAVSAYAGHLHDKNTCAIKN